MRAFLAVLMLALVTAVTPALAGHNGHGGGRGGPPAVMYAPGGGGRGGHDGRPHDGRGHDGRPHAGRPHVGLGHIIGGIRRHHPGRLSDVRVYPGPRGEPHYRVKWLTPEGRVLWLEVDPQTGEVINVVGQDR